MYVVVRYSTVDPYHVGDVVAAGSTYEVCQKAVYKMMQANSVFEYHIRPVLDAEVLAS